MSVDKDNWDEYDTIIERLEKNDEILRAMISMPERVNEEIVESRREKLFSCIWKELNMSKEFVLENVRNQEQVFMDQYEDELPNWLLRMEAQDALLHILHDKTVDMNNELEHN